MPVALSVPGFDSEISGGFGNAQECSVEQGGIYDDGRGGRARRLAAEAYRLTSARDARQSLRAVLPLPDAPHAERIGGSQLLVPGGQVGAIRHT